MMSSSDKSLLKENYLYKLKGVSKWFINIIFVHVIFSVVFLNFGGTYFTGGNVSIEIQNIIPYAELIFVSVSALLTTGFCLVEANFKRMSFTVPTTRKVESISNIGVIGTLAIFTTISALMVENLKIVITYFAKEGYDVVYMIVNSDFKLVMTYGVKMFFGLIMAGLIGYVISLLRTYHKIGLYIGIGGFIAGLILLGYLGVHFAIVNVVIKLFTDTNVIQFSILALVTSFVLAFTAYKIDKKGDVL